MRSSPKKNSQIPKKKTAPPPKKLPNQTGENRQNHGDQDKAAKIEEVNKNVQPFNFENELCNTKILVPFTELMKNPCYRNPILKMLSSHDNQICLDIVNLQEEQPTIILVSALSDNPKNYSNSSPPFYITLTAHDQMIHNYLLDSGASHNLMPKVVMEALGLSITKPYHDLYSFDSRAIKCLGVIKDLVVNLTQLHMKSVIMDVVVADITPKFGMLLSRSWDKQVGGTL